MDKKTGTKRNTQNRNWTKTFKYLNSFYISESEITKPNRNKPKTERYLNI